MAFEGLLTKLGPSLVRELSPHVLTLVSGFLERFRKDTTAMKVAVDAEIAELGHSQQALTALSTKQGEALESLHGQFVATDQKIDRLQQSLDATIRQIGKLEEEIRRRQPTSAALLYVVLLLIVLTLGGVITLFLTRR